MTNLSQRPVLRIPYTSMEFSIEAASVFGLLFILISVITAWPGLPNLVPQHFGIGGEVDAWGNKNSLLILPGTIVFMYVLFTILSRFPHIFNYPCVITEQNAQAQYLNARKLMAWLKTEFIYFLGYVEWKIIECARSSGKIQGLGAASVTIFIVVVFGTLGYYLYRLVKLK